MAFVHYLKKPELRNPVVVAAFAGWNDAAEAATTAIKFLMDRWKPDKFAEIVLHGAFLANIPHSIDVPISGFSSNNEMLERLREIDVRGSRYEGPTGIVGVLHDALRRANIPVTLLFAAAPHYLVATPNIKVTSALLTYLNTFLSFEL